jgi:plastocyanin
VQTGLKRAILAVLAVVTVGAAAFAIGRSAATSGSSVAANGPATSAASASASATSVEIKDFAFGPQTVTVKAGTAVKWTNQDGTDHSIQSATGAFGSQDIGQGQTFTASFSTPGTFAYICGIHHSMTGTVVVTA